MCRGFVDEAMKGVEDNWKQEGQEIDSIKKSIAEIQRQDYDEKEQQLKEQEHEIEVNKSKIFN